jgi:hypothetical protein
MRYVACAAILVGICPVLWSDSIRYGGKTLDNVYIRESGTLYYVQNPADGTVASVAKTDAQDVTISPDQNARIALLQQWKKSNEALRGVPPVTSVTEAVPPPAKEQRANVKQKNVPLRDALKATLRTQGLDYSVEGNYISVATPRKLREEPVESVRQKTLALNNQGDTMPKIVVRNVAAGMNSGQGMYGGGGMYGADGGNTGGMYGGGTRMGGYQSNGGAMMDNYGGYAGGMGGMGYTGMGYGVATFSNISDLFSTIDDRMVGETPAVIGSFGY